MAERVYLDWNATAPLRPEARAAMIATLDEVGNPSSVHAEGRRAKAIVEQARGQIAEAFGAQASDIVFTSGATEAAALALSGRGFRGSEVEHDAVSSWINTDISAGTDGLVTLNDPAGSTLQFANSETGVIQALPEGLAVSDFTQGFGKVPLAFDWSGVQMGLISAHKLGGPKGIGALVLKRGLDVEAMIKGGGQEMGRRSGTENVAAIAGFGAAAEAAARDLADGVWEDVKKLRNILESLLASGAKETILVGKESQRLPNTSCFAVPGWKGETQVMQMDLAGFAISAGSACSSGKVKASRVLRAMGYDETTAASAVRVSIGPQTTEEQITRFAEVWINHYVRHKRRAA
ncbi:cysteine desulfurase family protein [Qingshengfaniella alkalisoli]|uniref:Cysteine desulfurase n=1 Tax=Qingshengfaniella alkalisoli TaxID=2599296 RepID=A0A5B8I6P4_9RHOB|nr:cysteine desulfurase family protein [Qingshengfaniella alkalisoli]QDY69225.1 cysteine desulfurase [Qingshengfaniella alkalisoli]